MSGQSKFVSRLALASCALVAALAVGDPELTTSVLAAWTTAIIGHFDELFLWTATALLLVSIGLIVLPVGRIKLGTEPPEYSRTAWLAMLFAAGMGSGLVFWGVAEPLTHLYSGPSPGEPNAALALSFFHWGLHAWAIYAMAGLTIAYFAFCHRAPLTIAGPLERALSPLVPSVVVQFITSGATLLAMLAVVFGVAGTLANGVILLRTGLIAVGLTEQGVQLVQFGLLVLVSAAFLTSAQSGIGRSIRRLSLLNMTLAIALMASLLAFVPIASVGEQLLGSTWGYLQALPSWSTQLIAIDGEYGWARGWTVTYLIWWIAWAPFVGLFIARISRGRTVREFLIAVILVPTVVSIVWFVVLGGGALTYDQQNQGLLGEALQRGYTEPAFVWFSALPLGIALKLVAVTLLFVFLITSADSAAYVLGMIGENGQASPSRIARLSWGLVIVAISAALLFRNNVDINKAVAIVGAIPFTVVLWLYLAMLVVRLWRDRKSSAQGETRASRLREERN